MKQWLFGGQQIAADAALFPLDDYEGQMISDLFGEQNYFADADQFWTLQNAAVATKRDEMIEAGWTDVDILEIGDRFCTWEHEKTPKKEGGRVYISVSHRGEVEVHDGWLTRKEANAKRRAKEKQDGSGEAAKEVRPELTNPAQNYIELHRHAAVRHAMLAHTGVALRMMVAHAIGGSALWRTEADPQSDTQGRDAREYRQFQGGSRTCGGTQGSFEAA